MKCDGWRCFARTEPSPVMWWRYQRYRVLEHRFFRAQRAPAMCCACCVVTQLSAAPPPTPVFLSSGRAFHFLGLSDVIRSSSTWTYHFPVKSASVLQKPSAAKAEPSFKVQVNTNADLGTKNVLAKFGFQAVYIHKPISRTRMLVTLKFFISMKNISFSR